MKCNRCKYDWEYKGKKKPKDYPTYTSCPRCKSLVKIVPEVKKC
jgi:hypothetical protein